MSRTPALGLLLLAALALSPPQPVRAQQDETPSGTVEIDQTQPIPDWIEDGHLERFLSTIQRRRYLTYSAKDTVDDMQAVGALEGAGVQV